jgi:hypothetical protein
MSELSDLSKTTFSSDTFDHSTLVNDEQNELNRTQKEQQYQCINKYINKILVLITFISKHLL